MEKRGYTIAGIGIVLMLAVLCGSASAAVLEELQTVKSGTVQGGVYVGGGYSDGMPDTNVTQTFDVPSGNILWSRLYVDVWASGKTSGWLNLTYWNGTGNTENNQYLDYNYTGGANDETEGYYVSCGYGHYWKYWNVTDITVGGVVNKVTANTSDFSVGDIYGIVLITVYDDGGQSARYWINQGYVHIGDVSSYPCAVQSNTTWFNGTINIVNSTLWTIYLTGSEDELDYLYFNGHKFATDDAADGGGSTPDSTWAADSGFDVDSWFVDKTWLNPSSNNVTFRNNDTIPPGETSLRVVGAVLINKEPKPDLNVSEINPLVERKGQTPIALVANHTYTINATIINTGEKDATGFNVTLHENGTLKNDTYVSGLGITPETKEKVVQFNWTSLGGVYELKVTADAYDAVNESDETNNASTKIVTVLGDTGPADLVEPDITFSPAYDWHGETANNNTTIMVKVINNGTVDAGNASNKFKVQLIVDGSTVENKTTWLRAKSYRYVTFERYLAAGSHTVEVRLDPDDVVSEATDANNNAMKSVKIISCRILDSHHYGNTSAYNGTLSNYTTVNMFDVTKLVPENTTPVEFLKSVAVIHQTTALNPDIIDGLENGFVGGKHWWWCPAVNGIPVSWGNWTTYPLHEGDVVHWDFFAYIHGIKDSTEVVFKPRSVTDYPEPFLHGYNGTVWNTTIVYPEELSYPWKANAVKTRLNASGVPNERISVVSVKNVTNAGKGSNNLILLGTPANNPLIAEVSSRHSDVGLPVYFSFSGSGKQMIDDSDDVSYEVGGMVEACDNPWNGSANWEETGPSVWLASGIEDYWAYKAADLLACDTSKLDRTWVNRKPYLVPILNPNGTVTLDWGNWTGGSTYEIYITNNLTAGFPATPNATTTEKSWTDMNAADDEQRYYKVVNETIEGEVCKINYTFSPGANWISLPNTNPPILDADKLIKSIPNCNKVAWWNSTSQSAESYFTVTFPPYYVGKNFDIKPARGYEAQVTTNAVWTVSGWVPYIDPIRLKTGANWIGMPFNTTISDADGLIKDIPNCNKVAWWNSTSQSAESYFTVTFPPYYVGKNFDVKPARGYEAQVTADVTWTPQ